MGGSGALGWAGFGLLVTAAVICVTAEVEREKDIAVTDAQTRLALEALAAWRVGPGRGGGCRDGDSRAGAAAPPWGGSAGRGGLAIELARTGVLPSWG